MGHVIQAGAKMNPARQAGWAVAEVDRVEINEAFTAIALACLREIGFPEEIVNVEGGALSSGSFAIGSCKASPTV